MKINNFKDIFELAQNPKTNWQRYGHVYTKRSGDLLLFNYTPKAIYDNTWGFFETVSRGLIINPHKKEIVARPFDKFFNWFENGRKASGHIITIAEKVDGSLGVLYRDSGYKIATRGSFDSEQAIWATQFLNSHFDLKNLDKNLTLLFEIVYPDNKIIVDYGGKKDLILLAARNRFTGEYLHFYKDIIKLSDKYGFNLPKVYSFNSVTDILEDNGKTHSDLKEGYVVEFSDGQRFKFKHDEYLQLHKALSQITFKNTLSAIRNEQLKEFCEAAPEEFHEQINLWADKINNEFGKAAEQIDSIFAQAPKSSRKDFALFIKDYKKFAPYLFGLYDCKDVDQMLLQKWEIDQ